MSAANEEFTIEQVLAHYRGDPRYQRGVEGDRMFRETLATDALELTEESVRKPRLEPAEINDLLAYFGFNLWDFLGTRATEGESGLIPRQEYETLSMLDTWQRYPTFFRAITEGLGVDGVVELGAKVRREPGTKLNLLHIWCTAMAVLLGRGIAVELGHSQAEDRYDDVSDSLQFMRRLYLGAWDEGGKGMFAANRGYDLQVLDAAWQQRFLDEETKLDDPERLALQLRFNAGIELLSFLFHFDNRCGLADTGPYPVPGGGYLIVRDIFLREPTYHWNDACDGLPYCVTQGLVFRPEREVKVEMFDGSNIFTEPRNYLADLSGATTLVRDTPESALRPVEAEEMERIATGAGEAVMRLYAKIASMHRRDLILAGSQVYTTEFILPFARAAGMWDRFETGDLDLFEIDPVTAQAYYELCKDGTAMEKMPMLQITGRGFMPVAGDA
jgi:hypothetical protein